MSQSQEINLIPHDILMRDSTRNRIYIWAGIIPLVIILLSGFYVLEKKKIGAVESSIADLSLKTYEMEIKLNQLNILHEKRDRLARKERVINTLLNKRSLSLLFSELEKAMNDNVWLTSFNFKDGFSLSQSGQGKDGDMWVDTGYMIVKKDGSQGNEHSKSETPGVSAILNGNGYSKKDVAGFLEQLSGSALFSEVNLLYLREETIDNHSLVEFKIETYLKKM